MREIQYREQNLGLCQARDCFIEQNKITKRHEEVYFTLHKNMYLIDGGQKKRPKLKNLLFP